MHLHPTSTIASCQVEAGVDEQDNTLLSMFYLNKKSVKYSKMSYLKVDTDADRC